MGIVQAGYQGATTLESGNKTKLGNYKIHFTSQTEIIWFRMLNPKSVCGEETEHIPCIRPLNELVVGRGEGKLSNEGGSGR